MTQNEKAQAYEDLVRRGDIVQRELSKLKSTNINGNNAKENARMDELKSEMVVLENKLNNLFNQV
jgi:hypothetical protein